MLESDNATVAFVEKSPISPIIHVPAHWWIFFKKKWTYILHLLTKLHHQKESEFAVGGYGC